MLFFKKVDPIDIHGTEVILHSSHLKRKIPLEIRPVVRFEEKVPRLTIALDDEVQVEYLIEPIETNPDLPGQYIHLSIRVLENYAVMVDGLISKSKTEAPEFPSVETEGIRFQPFFIGSSSHINKTLHGKGLFERGLHFSGTVTPGTIRLICLCDKCRRSFSVQSFHAGFSDGQYFYSPDGSETLFVPNGYIEGIPGQLAKEIDTAGLQRAESKLPESKSGKYLYYNPFRCPHCSEPFIDFGKYPQIRPTEYYGNTFINRQVVRISET